VLVFKILSDWNPLLHQIQLFPIHNLKHFGRSKSIFISTLKSNLLYWSRVCKTNHDNALKFIYILVHSSPSSLPTNRQYLSIDDWDYLVQDIIDTHPGLKFLREAREFHSRYIKTVVARVFYNCNRSWSMKLTVHELRRSNFLQVKLTILHFVTLCFL
jgi:hypothetical protein